jgi:hypothetical protein
MKTINVLLIILLVAMQAAYGQFSPDKAKQSLVRITVKADGYKPIVCTGFLWQKNSEIVTSLHAMRPNATIEIRYHGGFTHFAKVKSTFANADLVLLEVLDLDANPVPAQAVAIKTFNDNPIGHNEEIHTVGYYGGGRASMSRSLKKGDLDPEDLRHVVIKAEYVKLLETVGFPQINLPIIYLTGGSLLPGFSGAPLFNSKGELIGIGNGGLESGQNNISWAIPAIYLEDLDKSQTASLPQNIHELKVLFSAQVELDETVLKNNPQTQQKMQELEYNNDDELLLEYISEQMMSYLEDEFTVYENGSFAFYQTKNRSFDEMYNSAFDPENLDFFADEFLSNNIIIDYQTIRFDVFEDVNAGITIVVPEDSELIYDANLDVFNADLSNYGFTDYFGLQYAGYTDEDGEIQTIEDAMFLIVEQLSLAYGTITGGLEIDEDYTYTIEVDTRQEVGYILCSGSNFFNDDAGNPYDLKLYLTILRDHNRLFYSMASMSLPVNDLAPAFANGIDCENYYENAADYCDFFEQMMRMVAATHLTTFANMQFTNQGR